MTDKRVPKKPTKKEWIDSLLDGFERTKFSGRVPVEMHWHNGKITTLSLLIEKSKLGRRDLELGMEFKAHKGVTE